MAFFMATGAALEFLLCHNKFWRKWWTSYPSAALWITGDLGLRGVVTTILPALGAILKPLGRNDYKAISTHFDATPSSKFFVYSFVTG